jgi:hypothetical protein
MRPLRCLHLRLTCAVVLGALAVPAVADAGVFDPGARPYGASYGEWSAAWQEWALSLPAARHPLLVAGHVNCSRGQSGRCGSSARAS